MNSLFLYLMLAAGGAIAVYRIWLSVKKLREQPANDWDTKLIERMRAQGSDPFKPHDVVFFFGFPAENAAQRAVERLVRESYGAEYRHVPDHRDLPFSVHAQKAVRLSIEDMQETSRRFNALAQELGGRYDGWAAAHNERDGTALPPAPPRREP